MKFWILEERDRFIREGDDSCYYSIIEPLNLADCPIICPVCQAVCCPRYWLPPRRIEFSKSGCGDLILGVAFELVVSEDFREVYKTKGLTGISDFGSVEVAEISRPAYLAARPNVTFAHLDEAASGVIWEQEPVCNHCRLGVISRLDSVVLDESTWDGSDLFMATGLYGIKLATDRFVEVVKDANLTNFVFVPASEYSIP